jgi:hypothetical protein
MTFTHEGKTLYRVEVETISVTNVYVLAYHEDDARDDARELALSFNRRADWETIDTHLSVIPLNNASQVHGDVWTGGEDGDLITWPPP